MRFNVALARRVALILGLSFPAFSNALAEGRAVLPPRWMVEAYLSDAVVKPSRDDIARAIIPGLGMVPAFLGGATDGPTPTFVAVSANGNGTTAAMPAGWAVGDLLMIFASAYLDTFTDPAGHNIPSGWAEIGSYLLNFNSQYRSRIRAFSRIAQSGDSTVSLTVSDGSSRFNSVMLAYRGVNTSSPFEGVDALGTQSASSSIPYAQITTLGVNRVVLQVITAWNTVGVASTPASGWTERFDYGSGIGIAIDERTFASAGLTSAGNQTRTVSVPWGRLAFAIKPAQI